LPPIPSELFVLLAHGLWFKHYCQRWRTFQGRRQSRTLEKW